MRNGIFSLILVFCSLASFGQISTQYTNFMFFRQVYNPAVAGSESYADFTGLFRGQWVGIKGAPLAEGLSFHAPISRISSGVGLVIGNETTGEQRFTNTMVNFAYGKNFGYGRLSGGIGIGFYQKALDGTLLKSPEGTYENGSINHNDNYIPNTNVSGFAPEMNAGIYFNNEKLFAGFSVTNLLQTKVKLTTPTGETSIATSRSLLLMGGYSFSVGKNIKLAPNLLVKTDLKNFQTDINVILQYKNNFYAGLTFRGSSSKSIDALAAMVGFRIFKDLSIGYSYDFSLSSLNNANSGSHEVYINYKLKLRDWSKPGKIIYNPRFL
jgi:type IX secretion system PorP/SprF family membrane protein